MLAFVINSANPMGYTTFIRWSSYLLSISSLTRSCLWKYSSRKSWVLLLTNWRKKIKCIQDVFRQLREATDSCWGDN